MYKRWGRFIRAWADYPLPEGGIIGRRYRVIAQIGIGSYGITYRCKQFRHYVIGLVMDNYFPNTTLDEYGHYYLDHGDKSGTIKYVFSWDKEDEKTKQFESDLKKVMDKGVSFKKAKHSMNEFKRY